MLKAKTRWLLPNVNPGKENLLVQELKISPLLARLLVHRGLEDPQKASIFLYPEAGQLGNPACWEGMEKVVHWLRPEILSKLKICIIGSDQADGICSASILLHILGEKGANVQYQMFSKREQHDLENMVRREQLFHEIDLLFLADLAISSQQAPNWEGALSLWQVEQNGNFDAIGIQPIISFNPHSSAFPIRDLSSSGWAFKLGQAILGEPPLHLLDLAMLGTIASEVPLVGENRVIAKCGLDQIKRPSTPGVRVWKEECRLTMVSVSDIKEVMVPWIEKTGSPVSMLTEMDYTKAKQLAIHRTTVQVNHDKMKETSYLPIDAFCHLSEISIKNIEELELLAPFGPGNEEPLFILNEVELTKVRTAGMDQSHLKCQLSVEDLAIEATGFGLGDLSKHISKQATGNVIGQWVLHEWNGIRKPHFLMKDLSISHTQIFDYRGTKDKERLLCTFWDAGSLILCFQKESLLELDSCLSQDSRYNNILYAYSEYFPISHSISHLFLYDLPHSLSDLHEILSQLPQSQRIFCLFGAEHQNQLVVIPSRDHFKWLYGVIRGKGYCKRSWVPLLAKSRGISEHAIRFMLDVFLDLDFVRNTGETMQIVESPNKRDLTESPFYHKKKQEMEIETELLYSSFEDLCLTFKKVTLMKNEEGPGGHNNRW